MLHTASDMIRLDAWLRNSSERRAHGVALDCQCLEDLNCVADRWAVNGGLASWVHIRVMARPNPKETPRTVIGQLTMQSDSSSLMCVYTRVDKRTGLPVLDTQERREDGSVIEVIVTLFRLPCCVQVLYEVLLYSVRGNLMRSNSPESYQYCMHVRGALPT